MWVISASLLQYNKYLVPPRAKRKSGGLNDDPPGMLWTRARALGTRTKIPDVETKFKEKEIKKSLSPQFLLRLIYSEASISKLL
jgi:hypothetical protein